MHPTIALDTDMRRTLAIGVMVCGPTADSDIVTHFQERINQLATFFFRAIGGLFNRPVAYLFHSSVGAPAG